MRPPESLTALLHAAIRRLIVRRGSWVLRVKRGWRDLRARRGDGRDVGRARKVESGTRLAPGHEQGEQEGGEADHRQCS
ncbi:MULTISPECIES: hypothetical protein [Novosphingobium]|uniref:hypothetical protein n=1 Tax=Novosphingobium sp. TCA1 TaxID=2682474 RepID=UPI001054D9CE|nr:MULTISPECIES: hypothetical protein [Novosphingobium]